VCGVLVRRPVKRDMGKLGTDQDNSKMDLRQIKKRLYWLRIVSNGVLQ
jgi:hypothetical protein